MPKLQCFIASQAMACTHKRRNKNYTETIQSPPTGKKNWLLSTHILTKNQIQWEEASDEFVNNWPWMRGEKFIYTH